MMLMILPIMMLLGYDDDANEMMVMTLVLVTRSLMTTMMTGTVYGRIDVYRCLTICFWKKNRGCIRNPEKRTYGSIVG